MGCLVGIDGGGSRTRAVAVDSSGALRAIATGGASNFQCLDKRAFYDGINEVLSVLCAQTGSSVREVKFVVAGFAGVGNNSDRKIVESIFKEFDLKNRFAVVTDMDIALYGALRNDTGIMLNAGTGSAAFCRDSSGTISRCGGWGFIVGDEGSGYNIGLSAIRYALQSFDTAIPKTALQELICNTFKIDSIAQVVSKIHSGSISRIDIAELAPIVLDEAALGDNAAGMIIEQAGSSLGRLVETLLKRGVFHTKPVDLCLSGSIFKKREIILPYVMKNIKDDVVLVDPRFPPVIGAVLLAFNQAHIPTNAAVINNLKKIKLE